MNSKILGYILAITTISIWSSTFILSKIMLETLTPYQVLVIRFAIAIIALTLMYPKFKFERCLKDELYFFIIGALLTFYFFFENSALMRTYASNVSLIDSTIPLMTGLIAYLMYKEKFFNRYTVIGFILSYGGVVTIVVTGQGLEGVEPLGDLFAVGAAIMFAFYTNVMIKVQERYHIIVLTRKVFVYSFITMLIITFVSGDALSFENFSLPLVGGLLYLGIVASCLAFLMWNKAIALVGSVKTNQFIYLIPMITMIFSVILLGEKVSTIKIVGSLVIVLGLYISDLSKKDTQVDPITPCDELL